MTNVAEDRIDCVVGPGVPGTAAVAVSVDGTGFATGNVSVIRDFALTGIGPYTGSPAGEHSTC